MEEKEETILVCHELGCGFTTHRRMHFQATHDLETHHQLFHSKVKDRSDVSESEGGRSIRRLPDSRRDGRANFIKLDRAFGGKGSDRNFKEKSFFDDYGAEAFRELIGEEYVPEVPAARRQPKPTEASAPGGNPPVSSRALLSRQSKGPKASADGDNVIKICKFCGVSSYSLPEQEAERWIADHQATSQACLLVQKGAIVMDEKSDRKKRFASLFGCWPET